MDTSVPWEVSEAVTRILEGCGCGHGGSCGHPTEDGRIVAEWLRSVTDNPYSGVYDVFRTREE